MRPHAKPVAGDNPAKTALQVGTPLVEASSLTVAFAGKAALDRVSVAIYRGEIVTLIGPNGAGKTTLARALLGLVTPSSGTVTKQAGLRVGYVPQRFPVGAIIPLSVRRFMTLNTCIRGDKVLESLSETGAHQLAEAQMTNLSGGEFQRVLLARALARDPDFLVLDEPAQAVDLSGAAQLYDLIGRIRDRRGCGILLISHDLHIVFGSSDRVVCLNRHLCCEGKPSAVAKHPEYARLFGGGAAESFALYEHRHDHTHDLSGNVV